MTSVPPLLLSNNFRQSRNSSDRSFAVFAAFSLFLLLQIETRQRKLIDSLAILHTELDDHII